MNENKSEQTLELFVSVTGNDQADGSRKRPLASWGAARDTIRRRRQAGAIGPVTVWIQGGTYRMSEPLVLEEQDSGTEQAPVIWRASRGAEVRISGGCEVDGTKFHPVSDPAILSRFEAPVRSHLLQLDLKMIGITDTGTRVPRGFGFGLSDLLADLDVVHQDRPLPIARWPRTSYAETGPVTEKGFGLTTPGLASEAPKDPAVAVQGGTFTSAPEKVRRWSRPQDLECFGMWAYDWAPSTVPVKCTDPERGLITLTAPVYGGVLAGRRYYVQNALEEIAQPGDWAVNREAGVLYLYPPTSQAELRLTLSLLKEPLVILRKTRWISLRHVTLECGRFHGLILDGEHNEVAGCIFRNLGGRGITVAGRHNRVQSCHIYQTGQGGISLNGGDRRDLTPGENVAENCEIHDFNRVCKTYNPAVFFSGCGNVMRYNQIYDGPHNAILLWGNDHIIEYNEIGYMGLECDDAAAFYMGRNPSEQGNILRYNYFHHIGCPTGWGTSAVYTDDGSCGLTVTRNIFYRCGHDGQVCMGAVFNNGGKDHRIENNIFVDCRIAFGNMQMLADHWVHFVRGDTPATESMRKILYEDVDIRSELYLRRYPWLKDLESNPSSSAIRRNLAVRCGVLVTPEERQTLEHNWKTQDDPGFKDLSRLEFGLKSKSKVFKKIPGFEAIPFKQIGLKKDEYRKVVPKPEGVDCRPEIVSVPGVQRPGVWVDGKLALHWVNRSDRPVSGSFELWTSHPDGVRFRGPAVQAYALAPGEVRCDEMLFEGCARPDVTVLIGARISGSNFSLPVPVRFQYQVAVTQEKALPKRGLSADILKNGAGLPFLHGDQQLGELSAKIHGDRLVLTVQVIDAQPIPDAGDGNWGGAYVGILVASPKAVSTAEVYQVVFFPHGPGTTGTIRFYIGHREVPAPEGIQWSFERQAGGWQLTAAVPLKGLNLTGRAKAFRFEAMVNVMRTAEGKPALITLFGSKTARLELATLATVKVVPPVG